MCPRSPIGWSNHNSMSSVSQHALSRRGATFFIHRRRYWSPQGSIAARFRAPRGMNLGSLGRLEGLQARALVGKTTACVAAGKRAATIRRIVRRCVAAFQRWAWSYSSALPTVRLWASIPQHLVLQLSCPSLGLVRQWNSTTAPYAAASRKIGDWRFDRVESGYGPEVITP